MTVNPIHASSFESTVPLNVGGVAPEVHGESDPQESFSSLIRGLLDKANSPHVEADAALKDLIGGETDNVHNVVMTVAKADLSFRFMLELRNRLTEAYQEVMRMQV